jgi:hypothetical protein
MNTKAKLLLFSSLCNAVVSGWISIWFVKVFIVDISTQVYSTSNIIQGIVSLVIVSFILGTRFEIPSIRFLLIYNFISYLSLFCLYNSISTFLIVSGMNGAILLTFMNLFNNALTAQNIDNEYRYKFDNRRSFINDIGYILGVAISLVVMPVSISLIIVWLVLFILSDVGFILLIGGIKSGLLKYERKVK